MRRLDVCNTALLLVFGVMAGCGDKAAGVLNAPVATQEEVGGVSMVEDSQATGAVLASAPKRLSIDQLEGSMAVLTGSDSLTWQFVFNGAEYGGFHALGVTLGRPDYDQLTEENREPTALYIKLMGDMAADVCGKLIIEEVDRPLDERVFLRFEDVQTSDEAVIRENLRSLKLFYLGEYVTDDAGVDDLATVFQTAWDESADSGSAPLQSARDSWQAVCMALMTSPNFHIY